MKMTGRIHAGSINSAVEAFYRPNKSAKNRSVYGWALPDLTGDPPAFEMVWEQLDTVISQQESS